MAHDTQSPLSDTARADRRLLVFNGKRGWQIGILVPSLVLGLSALWFFRSLTEASANGDVAVSIDFRVFWAAARLAFEGTPLLAFDERQLESIHGIVNDEWMLWLYPPGFLIALMPLGSFEFGVAWIIFTAASLLAMLAAIRPFSGGLLPVWLAFGLAPACFPSIVTGQTSVLWTAGLVGALAAIRAGNPIVAGILIGLLTLKPQLGVLIPIALLACGAWRTIFVAFGTMIAISIAATVFVGTEYWPEMIHMMRTHMDFMRESISGNGLMVSPYAMLTGLGFSEQVGLSIQWFLTAMSALAVALAWYSPRVCFDMRAAVLLIAIMLSSPYFWYYECTLAAPAALFMLRAGILRTDLWGLLLAGALWVGLGPANLSDTLMANGPLRFIFPPIVLLAFFVCLSTLFQRLRTAPAAAVKTEEIR